MCLAFLVCLSSLEAQSGTPSIYPGGVVNAAKYTTDLAPGIMASVFGMNLAAGITSTDLRPLPTTIAGVSVEITESGKAAVLAPLYFVSPGQVNFQMPFGIAAATVQVKVKNANGTSAAVTATLQAVAPALFTADSSGSGDPLVLHAADYSMVNGPRPAMPHEYLVLMMTGMGEVSPLVAAGRPGGDNGQYGPINYTLAKPQVYIGGHEAVVSFSGLMPGFPGVYQVNAQVPGDLPAGVYGLEVRANGTSSQTNLTILCSRDYPVLASVSVGATGGTITGGGMEVQLPAGLFAGATTVVLTSSTDTQPGGIAQISDVFTLRGLPAELTGAVTVKIPLRQSPPPGTQTLVAVDSGPGVHGTGITFLEALVEGTSALVTLPASGPLPAPATRGIGVSAQHPAVPTSVESEMATGPEITFWVGASYLQHTTGAGHFLIFYPRGDSSMDDKARTIGLTLEDSYKQLEGLGLSWSARTRWPMRVVITPLTGDKADTWGEQEPSILGKNYWSITLNAAKIAGAMVSDDLKATAGHELFHVLQDLYDPRSAYRVAKFSGSWLWFDEAASTWFENLVTGQSDAVPATVKQDNYAFLTQHGLEYQPGDIFTVRNHGYGASMFLHYLADHAGGASIVGNILKDSSSRAQGILAESLRWPAEATSAVLPGMLSEKWRNFVAAYTEGSLPGAFPDHRSILSQLKSQFAFSTEATAAPTFSWNAPSLSAGYYLVRFQAWPKDTRLSFAFKDPDGEAQLSIYRVHGNTWSLVTRTRPGSYEFVKPEDLVTNGESLLLVVANANGSGRYTGSTPLEIVLTKSFVGVTSYKQSFHGLLYNEYYELDFDVSVDGTAPFKVNQSSVYTGMGGCCFSILQADLITPAIDLATMAPGKDQVDEFTVTVTYRNLKRGPSAPGGWVDGMLMQVKAGFDDQSAMVTGSPTTFKVYKVTRGGKPVASTFWTELLWPSGTPMYEERPVTITFSPSK